MSDRTAVDDVDYYQPGLTGAAKNEVEQARDDVQQAFKAMQVTLFEKDLALGRVVVAENDAEM